MTDAILPPAAAKRAASLHTGDAAKARLKARYAAERRFKWLGAGAVALSALFLVLLLSTVVIQAIPALRMNYMILPVDLSAANVDPAKLDAVNYDAILQNTLAAKFPDADSRQDRRLLRGLISTGAGVMLRKDIAADPAMLGQTVDYAFPVDDFADLYLKGLLADTGTVEPVATTVAPSATTGDIDLALGDDSLVRLARGLGATEGEGGSVQLGSGASSMLLSINGGVVKLTGFAPGADGATLARGLVLATLAGTEPALANAASVRIIDSRRRSAKSPTRKSSGLTNCGRST